MQGFALFYHPLENQCQDISEAAIQTWLNGDDLLTLPRLKEHFLWFIPTRAHSGFEKFWNTANDLRKARRQLGRVISECAQEGWRDRNSDDVIFQYQQVFITVGELRDAMQILRVIAVFIIMDNKEIPESYS